MKSEYKDINDTWQLHVPLSSIMYVFMNWNTDYVLSS